MIKSPNSFVVEDVADDGACFYRAVANVLRYRTGKDSYQEFIECEFEDDSDSDSDDPEDFLCDPDWGYIGDEQTITAKNIQQSIRKWLMKNRKQSIPDIGGITVEEFVTDVHELDVSQGIDVAMENYNLRYKRFAGAEDPKGKELEDRWAGGPEQYALSQLLKRPVRIFECRKRLKRLERGIIYPSRFGISKNSVFSLKQSFGLNFTKGPIDLLFKSINSKPDHYLALYER